MHRRYSNIHQTGPSTGQPGKGRKEVSLEFIGCFQRETVEHGRVESISRVFASLMYRKQCGAGVVQYLLFY
ncbi:unnamed protein product [Periconia digitata]|uniref:Uncharacterized protein n=1 Tax=Periconia digitata TaxID=1303443 RepID=A0A9W4UD22_9PLEO|nr:unnamed protein product [Periconia digitata]